eukprot:11305865-Alexandrium_andersonii.AAC.1
MVAADVVGSSHGKVVKRNPQPARVSCKSASIRSPPRRTCVPALSDRSLSGAARKRPQTRSPKLPRSA